MGSRTPIMVKLLPEAKGKTRMLSQQEAVAYASRCDGPIRVGSGSVPVTYFYICFLLPARMRPPTFRPSLPNSDLTVAFSYFDGGRRPRCFVWHSYP